MTTTMTTAATVAPLMMKHQDHGDAPMMIVVASSLASPGDGALQRAHHIARTLDARVHLVHVVDERPGCGLWQWLWPPPPALALRVAQAQVLAGRALQQASLAHPSGGHRHEVRTGDRRAQVLAAAAGGALLVMGMPKATSALRTWHGAFWAILRNAALPVLVVRPGGAAAYRRALLPVSGTQPLGGLLALVHGVAPRAQVRLSVALPALREAAATSPAFIGHLELDRRRKAQRLSWARQLAALAEETGVAQERLSWGLHEHDPWHAAVSAQRQWRPDLLVLTPGRAGGTLESWRRSLHLEAVLNAQGDVLWVPGAGQAGP